MPPLDFLRSFVDFSGGINSDASSYTIKDDEQLSTSRNYRVDPLGPALGRKGQTLLNAAAGYELGTGSPILKPIRSLHRYYLQSGSHSILFTLNNRVGKTTYATPGTATNVPPAGGLATDPAFLNAGQTDIDQAWEFVTYKDWAYFTTQLAFPRRTNGTAVYKVGEAGDTTTAAAVAGGSLPVGTYRYRLTRVYAGGLGESPMGTEFSATTAAANLQIQMTLPGFARDDISAYNVYRSLVGTAAGVGPYYKVVSQGPGVFLDNTAETAVGLRLDQSKVEPAKAAFSEIHQDRLFLASLTEAAGDFFFDVMCSNPNAPEEFPARFRYRFPNRSGEKLTGMRSHNGMLVLTTMNHVFGLIGTGIERGALVTIPDYRIVLLARGPGAMSHRSIQERDGILYMTNKDDVWVLSGQEFRSLSEFRVRKFLTENLDQTRANLAIGAITRNQYRLTFPVQGGATPLPAMTLIYDIQANAFLADEGYKCAAYSYLDGDMDPRELWASEAGDFSLLYRMDSTTSNLDWNAASQAGAVITRRFRTRDFSFGRAIGETVQHRALFLEGLNTGANVQLRLYLNKDRTTIDLGLIKFATAGPFWAGFTWGAADWAVAGQITKFLSLPQTAIAQRISVEVTQLEDQNPFQIEMLAIGGEHKLVRAQSFGGT